MKHALLFIGIFATSAFAEEPKDFRYGGGAADVLDQRAAIPQPSSSPEIEVIATCKTRTEGARAEDESSYQDCMNPAIRKPIVRKGDNGIYSAPAGIEIRGKKGGVILDPATQGIGFTFGEKK